jgi:hypothetical protein
MNISIRNYTPSDLAAIQRIHEQNGIDYRIPDLNKFPVNKVLSVDGRIRASYGLQHTVEAHLWLDKESWTDAAGKWAAVQALDKEASEDAATLGVSSSFCCIPPGYERFGRRIKELGFREIRPDWTVFTKEIQ